MLAARQGKLPDMILSLLDYGEDPNGYRAGKTLLKNLKSLLVFWQEHYLHKDKVRCYRCIGEARCRVVGCRGAEGVSSRGAEVE